MAIIIVIFSPPLSDAKATIPLLLFVPHGLSVARLQVARPLIEASFGCGPTDRSPTVI